MADELDDLREDAAFRLDAQAGRAAPLQQYFDGEGGIIALLDQEERRVFRSFLAESSANWAALVVGAVAERLQVVGFRFAGADADAWLLWQANAMDADAEMVQTDALVTGQGLLLVQPDESSPVGVSITPEAVDEACVLYERGYRRRRRAGYKRYVDEDGSTTEVLILPDLIVTWRGKDRRRYEESNPGAALVEIVPQPRTKGAPRSELTPVIPIQDRINTVCFNRLVAMDYGAFRQIWASGVRIARDVIRQGEDGEAIRVTRPFDIGSNRLLTNEDPAGRFGSFPESTLRGYLDSAELDVQHLAAITQTPPHYLLGQMTNISADAIKAAEAGLVAKVGRRALHIGEGYEEVMRVALGLVGNPAATDVEAEVLWRDFETRSLGQLVDALVKLATLGVPRSVLWQRYGATPQEVTRWEQLAAAEQIAAASSAAVALGAPGEAYARMLATATGGAGP